MGLRSWTRRAIEDGGTLCWLAGLATGLLVECLVAAAFAGVGLGLLLVLFPPEVVRRLFGARAFVVAWLSATAGLFLVYTRGTFTGGAWE